MLHTRIEIVFTALAGLSLIGLAVHGCAWT